MYLAYYFKNVEKIRVLETEIIDSIMWCFHAPLGATTASAGSHIAIVTCERLTLEFLLQLSLS